MSRTGHIAQPAAPRPERLTRPVMIRATNMDAGSHYPPHAHDWGQLVYAVDGTLGVETEAGSWLAPPQRAVWVPPGVAHAVGAAGPAAFRSLYVDRAAAGGLPEDLCVLEIDPLLRELVRAAAAVPADYAPDGPDGRLIGVLMDRLAAAPRAPLHLPLPRDRRLKRICAALTENPADPRGLEDFAAAAGASARTLARHFRNELGLTFRQWKTRRVLMAAIERLADGAPVTAVAYDMGYDSPSAFIAMFRRETGSTPGQYLNTKAR